MASKIWRTAGAATFEPDAPWLTTTTTAYFGRVVGPNAANHAVACLPKTSPVPVLPATG